MIKDHNKTAVVSKKQAVSYKELLQRIHCYSEAFKQYSTEKILLLGENSLDWIVGFFATLKNDAIAIPVDIQSTVKEISYIIEDSMPELIYCSVSKKPIIETVLSEINVNIPILTEENIDISNVDNNPSEEFSPSDIKRTAIIIYTSGTTGMSKGVMLSYENILFNLNAVCYEVPIITKERNTMVLLPLHHIFPLLGSMVAPLYSGGTIYIADGLNSESILQTLNEGKINLVIGVPRLYDTLANGVMEKINAHFLTRTIYKMASMIQSRKFSKMLFKTVHQKFGGYLDYLVSGGAALSKETAAVFKTLGFYVLEGYGMTETSPMITFTRPGRWKIGYAGDPLSGIEVKTDAKTGEICVKGPNVMQGYYNRREETSAVLEDGWLHTGDLGFVDKHGIKLTGRLKEVIVTSNGKNIIPEELEIHLTKTSPYIREAGVFMHEDILQVLIYPEITQVRTKSIEELPDLIKQVVLKFNTEVSPYKRIKRFHIISEELPKTRLGKIQRFKLSEFTVQKQQQKEACLNKSYSEEYHLLKDFIDKETGYIASENDHFEIDLAMDSLTRVALIAHIENSFGIVLEEEQLNDLNTLAKLSAYIEEKKTTMIHNKQISWKEILAERIPKFNLPRSGRFHYMFTVCSKWMFKFMYRLKSKGVKNIPNEPCIIVANHQSALDGLLITASMKKKVLRKTYFFAKEKHWESKWRRSFAKKNNVILMDINKNLREALQKLSYVLREGKNVIIFPEGTRSKEGIKDFKETFAILSKELNIPIVPVVIYGSDRASFRTVRLPRYTPITVEVLQPIFPYLHETTQGLRDRVKHIFEKKMDTYKEGRK